MNDPAEYIGEMIAKGLYRSVGAVDCRDDGTALLDDGRRVVNFASNDYLGLAWHPLLLAAFEEGLARFGAGSMASRLVTGTRSVHLELEDRIAGLKKSGAALAFSSGYATSVGLIPCVVGKDDIVLLDKLSHASLIDGAKLSGARIATFLHNDCESLSRKLERFRRESPGATILIITESVFSMDGDRAPLREIADIKDKYGALLLVDEAHGFGVIGPNGGGLAEELDLQDRIDFQMGTLSKAAGLSGGYVACSQVWRDVMINSGRSFIYSTAPPPALAHAALCSLELISGREGSQRRSKLRELSRLLDPGGEFSSAIFPLVIGGNEEALALAGQLRARGFLTPAIRYPTVPDGTARLRMTLTASHTATQVEGLRKAIASLTGV